MSSILRVFIVLSSTPNILKRIMKNSSILNRIRNKINTRSIKIENKIKYLAREQWESGLEVVKCEFGYETLPIPVGRCSTKSNLYHKCHVGWYSTVMVWGATGVGTSMRTTRRSGGLYNYFCNIKNAF